MAYQITKKDPVIINVNSESDFEVIGEPSKNDVVKWNGTEWVPAVYNESFTFSISNFSNNLGSTTKEIGVGEWLPINGVTFTQSYNNPPCLNAHITCTDSWGFLIVNGAGFDQPTDSLQAVSYPSVGYYRQFRLYAEDAETFVNSADTFYFYNRRYFDVSTNLSVNESQIKAMSNELSNSRTKTFTVNAGAGEYIYYNYPTRLGTATFFVGGFEGGFESPLTVSITNALGFTENFYSYRSTNSGLGTTTVTVS